MCKGRPVHCGRFSSIPGLYLLDASSNPPSTSNCDNQTCLQTLSNVTWGAILPQWRTTVLESIFLESKRVDLRFMYEIVLKNSLGRTQSKLSSHNEKAHRDMTCVKSPSGLVVRSTELLIYRSFHSFPCVILVFLLDSHYHILGSHIFLLDIT